MTVSVITVAARMLVVVVSVRLDRFAGDFIANEDQHRFEEIPEAALGSGTGRDTFADAGEDNQQDEKHGRFDHHEFGDTEAGLALVEIPELAEGLRNDDFATQVVIVGIDLRGIPFGTGSHVFANIAERCGRCLPGGLPGGVLRQLGIPLARMLFEENIEWLAEVRVIGVQPVLVVGQERRLRRDIHALAGGGFSERVALAIGLPGLKMGIVFHPYVRKLSNGLPLRRPKQLWHFEVETVLDVQFGRSHKLLRPGFSAVWRTLANQADGQRRIHSQSQQVIANQHFQKSSSHQRSAPEEEEGGGRERHHHPHHHTQQNALNRLSAAESKGGRETRQSTGQSNSSGDTGRHYAVVSFRPVSVTGK